MDKHDIFHLIRAYVGCIVLGVLLALDIFHNIDLYREVVLGSLFIMLLLLFKYKL